jgi:hypothetical protein
VPGHSSTPPRFPPQYDGETLHLLSQKRLERLQLGGIAQSNEGLIRSRPGSAGTPRRTGSASGTPRAAWDSPNRLSGSGSILEPSAGHGSGSGAFGLQAPSPPLVLSAGRLGTSSVDEVFAYERVVPASPSSSLRPSLAGSSRCASWVAPAQ